VTIRGHVIIGLSCIFFFLFLVLLKVNISARNEYRKGEVALANKDLTKAIIHFDRAIHWYSPGSKAVKDSMDALWNIGAQSEGRGDYGMALQAFRSLRSSLYSVRSFYTPHPDWIERCDDRIADILVQEQATGSSNKGAPPEAKKKEILEILNIQTEPDVFWSVLLEIGFLGWIGCSIAFIFRAFSGQKGFNVKAALGWGIFVIFFYALWIVGMLQA
jgi:hypothetical protein